MTENKRIGIFGGTFDPVHIGHRDTAVCFAEKMNLDLLYIIPNRTPPLKEKGGVSGKDRLNMLKIAFSDRPDFVISDIELNREGVSYTCDTVRQLRQRHPEGDFFLLTGDDWIGRMKEWKNADYLLDAVTLVVADRSGRDVSREAEEIFLLCGKRPVMLNNRRIVLSSTQLRSGLDPALLPNGVYDYIRQKGLYGAMTSPKAVLSALKLSQKRMKHTLGVAEAAKMLAKNHFPHLDPELVEVCALMHDFTKEYSVEEQFELCKKYCITLSEEEKLQPKLLHSKTAAHIARDRFGVSQEGFDAIFYHTTGRADMAPLEQVIYLADYIEEFRDDEGCIGVRNYYLSLFANGDPLAMEKALAYSFDVTLLHLIEEKKSIFLGSVEARNYYTNLMGRKQK